MTERARYDLHRETEAAKVLRANLADILEIDDEQTYRDMVEGETDLFEAIDRAVQVMVEDKIAHTGLDAMINTLMARRDRIQARMDNMRTALFTAMEQAGKTRIDHPAVRISLRPMPLSVIVTDESIIPHEYFKAADPRLDKRAVLAALKDKKTVPGAEMSNGGQTIALSWT